MLEDEDYGLVELVDRKSIRRENRRNKFLKKKSQYHTEKDKEPYKRIKKGHFVLEDEF